MFLIEKCDLCPTPALNFPKQNVEVNVIEFQNSVHALHWLQIYDLTASEYTGRLRRSNGNVPN